jgi:NADH-quinone oxidoreductase subunit A
VKVFTITSSLTETIVEQYVPILVYLVVVIGMAVFTTLFPQLISPRKPTPIKDMPYESGMDPIGSARQPLDVKFYLIAILLLVFDVELLFLLPWAVALRAEGGLLAEDRLAILAVVILLLATLFWAYVIAWKKGVFEWRRP